MRTSFCAALIVVGTILPGLLQAQNEVQLTVSVTGANGAPLLELSKADFSLSDSGKPRAIDTFRTTSPATPAPPLAANEYTNAPDGAQPGAVFVVLDTIHTRFVEERDIRENILRFLARAAQAKRTVCLAILSKSGLQVYHDYRTSSDVLQAALIRMGVRGLQGMTPPAEASEAETAAEAARLTAFRKGDRSNPAPLEETLMQTSVNAPLAMFREVSYAAAGLPNRKSLVWITNIVPFEINSKTFQFESPKADAPGAAAVAGARSLGVRDVFTEGEVKQLMPLWRQSIRALFDAGVSVYPVEAQNSFAAGSGSFTQSRMQTLAQLTGGKAIYGTNDPLAELLQSSSVGAGYLLGVSEPASGDTQFHRLQVSLARAGAVVSAPAGYFPLAGSPKSRAGEQLNFALRSPLMYSGLTFRVRFAGVEDSAGKKKVNLVILVPGDAGVLNESTRTVDVAVLGLAKDSKDATVGKLNQNTGGQVPPEAVAQIKEFGFQSKLSIEVPSSGQFTLRIALYDNQTGRIGSLIAPMAVP